MSADILADIADMLTGLYVAALFFGYLVVAACMRAARSWGRG